MSDKEEKKTIGTPNSDEEEQLHFEIPKEMHDALSQLVKYQNTCFRECTTLLAGFKATKGPQWPTSSSYGTTTSTITISRRPCDSSARRR